MLIDRIKNHSSTSGLGPFNTYIRVLVMLIIEYPSFLAWYKIIKYSST